MKNLPRIAFDRESVRQLVPQEGNLVYRMLAADGTLLRVGASCSPRSRLLEHVRNPEYSDTVFIALEYFKTSTAMAREERRAIEDEKPLLESGFGRRHKSWKAQPVRSRKGTEHIRSKAVQKLAPVCQIPDCGCSGEEYA